MISFALATAGLVAAAILVIAHAVRLGRRGTSQAIANVAAYGYGATAPVTTERQAKRSETNLRLELSLARIARRLSSADYESTLRIRLLQAGLYGFRPSRFLMIRVLGTLALESYVNFPIGRAMFDCVIKQVKDHLPQQTFIAAIRYLWKFT